MVNSYNFLLGCILVIGLNSSYGQSVSLIKDINQTSAGSSFYHQGAVFNNLFIFDGDDGQNGEELWVTDGTEAGTHLLVDIYEGPESSNPRAFTALGNAVLFIANDGEHGLELWRTDGTTDGTMMVKDIVTGEFSATIRSLTRDDNRIFFKADYDDQAYLYVSDGTEAGTIAVKQGDRNSGQTSPDEMVVVNHILYFRADDGAEGSELWRSNGTEPGTTKVSETAPMSSNPESFFAYNSMLLFSSGDFTLYQSDGTDVGTKPFQNLSLKFCAGLTVFNENLYFTENVLDTDGDAIDEAIVRLWKFTGASPSVIFEAKYLDILGVTPKGLFLAVATGDDEVRSLWISNGTSGGTVAVKEITKDTGLTTPTNAVALGDDLIFTTWNPEHGADVWVSDGTVSGTTLIADINPDGFGFLASETLTQFGDKILFWADNETTGLELWSTDGTSAGTGIVKDISSRTAGSFPYDFTRLGEEVLFIAHTELEGQEIWKTDGSASGTTLVKDISPDGSTPSSLTAFNNAVYFNASNGVNGYELWKTDGTEAGTEMVLDMFPGLTSSFPTNLFVFNDHLYFWAMKEDAYGLWESDGTTDGTTFVAEVDGPYTNNIAPLDDFFVYFNNMGLWRSDGTEAGTVLVKAFDDFQSTSFAVMDSWVYFAGNDATAGLEIWKSDGTTVNTVRVRDIYAGDDSSFPQYITYASHRIFFSADDGTHGPELWKTDGSLAGTVLVEDVYPGVSGAGILWVKALNDEIFFNADDGVHGNELWKSTGTAATTDLFFDFSDDENSSFEFPGNAGVTGDKLFMNLAGDEMAIGITDGTLGETKRLVLDAAFLQGPFADQVFSFNNIYLFNGYTDDIGEELWAIDYRADQGVTFTDPGDKTYGDADFELEASSSSGLPVTFSTNPHGVVEIDGTISSIVKPGEVTIVATQEGNSFIKPASAQHTITVDKATQSIIFPAISDKILGDPDFEVEATTTSGLPVSFTSTTDKVVMTNSIAELLKAGRTSIVAGQEGNAYYKAAATVEQSFCIHPAMPVILYDEDEWPVQLASNSPFGNQWYLNGTALAGVTDQMFFPTESGTYTVMVTVDDCESLSSGEVAIIILGTEHGADPSLTLSPNPADHELKISTTRVYGTEGHLITSNGQKVQAFYISGEDTTINVATLPPGLYFIRLTDSQGVPRWNKFMKR